MAHSNKKIKVFLGGYTNYTNAQNLNCRALAQHLDKEKFAIYTLELYSGKLSSIKGKGISVFHCFRPHRISIYLGYFWGIWHCDVAYLPKGELWKYNAVLLRLFRKKSFSTIEGILDDENMASAIEVLGSSENVLKSYTSYDKLFPITRFLGNYNHAKHGIKCEPQPLYLGCDTAIFNNSVQRTGQLKTIIYIGRLKKRKGIYDIVELAGHFPETNFYIYGDGEEVAKIKQIVTTKKLNNLILKAVVSHTELAKVMETADLHILPSRSEGFPKVTLETAAAGVPSIVYNDYGADEWIANGKNGWIVKTLDEMIGIIRILQVNPQTLEMVSKEAVKLAQSFDWKIKVKDWEEVILHL